MVDFGPRSEQYHKRRCRGPWLLALARLHKNGWSDGEIAEALSDLSEEAILRLEDRRRWNWRGVEAALVPESSPLRWTQRQVRYYRRKLELDATRRRWDGGSLAAVRAVHLRNSQKQLGWAHLLPRYDERLKEWLPGHELRKVELVILCLLRDLGTMSRRQLAKALGCQSRRQDLHTGGVRYLRRLERAGLVIRDGREGRSARYKLADTAKPPARKRLETGIEKLARTIRPKSAQIAATKNREF